MGQHAEYGVVVSTTPASQRPAVKTNVAIIGAGPAGLMAAEVIASAGHSVTIYERMPSPARKFLMAGRGGLNLTHSEPLQAFLDRYGAAPDAVRLAVERFPPARLTAWADSLGAETFIGSSGRVFPKAMKASPLLRAWLQRLADLGVTLKTSHTWTGFRPNGGLAFTTPDATSITITPDATVLALGGASWPRLGSDGAWVELMRDAGIAVEPLAASNCGVLIPWSEHVSPRFAGTPLKRIAVTCGSVTRRGEAVLTRSGLEGGVIYALGPAIRDALRVGATAELRIDLKPYMSEQELTARLSKPQGSQSRSNFLRKAAGLDPALVALVREAGPLPETPDALAARIKALPVTVNGLASLDRSISTAGGVRLSSLTPEFMATARPGLFLAGEMLDWDAPTGGYLLQASIATGFAAAEGVVGWLRTPAAAEAGRDRKQPPQSGGL